MSSIYDWSVVAANNSNSDAAINWAEGQAPSTVNNSARQLEARVREFITDIGGSIAAGGTANGLTITIASAFTALADGQIVSFRATASNTGAATLNVNSIGAKAIRKMNATGDVAIVANEIRNTGIYVAKYSAALNGAAGAWLLINPTFPVDPSTLVTLTGTQTLTNKTFSDTVTADRFASSAGAAVFGGDSAKAINLRPQGVSSTTSQVVVDTDGSVTADRFASSASSAVFGGDSAKTISLRPQGIASTTNQTTIDTSGNVVITGTVSGTAGTFSGIVRSANGSAGAPTYSFASSTTTGLYRTTSDGGIGFTVGGVSKGAFHSTGFTVCLGSSPDQLISSSGPLEGCSMSSAGAFTAFNASAVSFAIGRTGDGAITSFARSGVAVGSIAVSAGATAYNTSSDKRLKTPLRQFDSGSIIDRLKVGEFNWLAEPDVVGYGVLAQDAYKVFPTAIHKPKKRRDNWEVDYSKFVPLLLAEIKDLRRRLAAAGL